MRQIRKLISIFAVLMLVLTIFSFLSTNAFAETNVKEIVIYTDSSWKVLDAKVSGWTAIDFDDSYWLNPKEGDLQEGWNKALNLIYPESPSSKPFFWRKTFELSGAEIISGKLYSTITNGWTTVYVNENKINNDDIIQYLKLGKNTIAVESSNDWNFRLISKIRMVTGIPTSSPIPMPASTIAPISTDATVPISTQTISQIPDEQHSDSASVSLTGEKTDVVFGEDIVFKLSAVNLITKPVMHVQVIILVPSGMSVTSSEFSKSGTNQFTANYELNPGDGKDVEVKIRPNQVGDFNVNGRIVYYFDEDKNNPEDHTLNLPIKVRGINPTSQPTPQPKTPGFEIIFVIGMLIISYLYTRKT